MAKKKVDDEMRPFYCKGCGKILIHTFDDCKIEGRCSECGRVGLLSNKKPKTTRVDRQVAKAREKD